MVGRAVLTTEMSRTTRIWAVRARASTAQDLRGPLSGVGSGRGSSVGWRWTCSAIRMTAPPYGQLRCRAVRWLLRRYSAPGQRRAGADGADDVVDGAGGDVGTVRIVEEADV